MTGEPRRVDIAAEAYDDRWARLAAAGHEVHGEARLVQALLVELLPGRQRCRVLDAGCGTGRVAIELARAGHDTVGVDVDPAVLGRARAKAPTLAWAEADLASLPSDVAPGPFDAAVMAGNVMIFVAPGTEANVLTNLATRLTPAGFVVAGFQLLPGRLTVDRYDEHARAAGLTPVTRFSTWERDPWSVDSSYVVTVARAGAG